MTKRHISTLNDLMVLNVEKEEFDDITLEEAVNVKALISPVSAYLMYN